MKLTLRHSRTRYLSKLREVNLWRSGWHQQEGTNQRDEEIHSSRTKELYEVTEEAGKHPYCLYSSKNITL